MGVLGGRAAGKEGLAAPPPHSIVIISAWGLLACLLQRAERIGMEGRKKGGWVKIPAVERGMAGGLPRSRLEPACLSVESGLGVCWSGCGKGNGRGGEACCTLRILLALPPLPFHPIPRAGQPPPPHRMGGLIEPHPKSARLFSKHANTAARNEGLDVPQTPQKKKKKKNKGKKSGGRRRWCVRR